MTSIQYKALLLMSALFLVYFQSELILREAAISVVDKDKIKIDNVLSKLPGNVRDNVRKKIEIASLRDAVLAAKTDSARVSALISLALSMDEDKKNSIFAEVVKTYPKMPESLSAYCGLLGNSASSHPVSIQEYHAFIGGLEPLRRLEGWSNGLASLRQNCPADKKIIFDYLKPLVDIEPDYREYYSLYDALYELALDNRDDSVKEIAELKRNNCAELPSSSDIERISKEGKKNNPAPAKSK